MFPAATDVKSAEKSALNSGAETVMYEVSVLVSSSSHALVIVSETRYVPGVEYVTVGFSSVEVAGFPPSNVQVREVW